MSHHLQYEKGKEIGKIILIRRDHGREFENSVFSTFRNIEGIGHEFSTPITPQQNGVVEKKNRALQING